MPTPALASMRARSHIEHLVPQDHCQRGQEDVAYGNMVACYPAPNSAYVPFGALRKANWPSPAEQHLFVSPRSAGCERRFTFNIRGKISVAENDEAAGETVKRLGLDNKRLEDLRKEAIDATLQWHGRNPPLLDLQLARKRLIGWKRLKMQEVGSSRSASRSNKLSASISNGFNRSGNRKDAKDPDHGEDDERPL